MSFRIFGLAPEPFAHLFALSDEELAEHGAVRQVVSADTGFPCRISLRAGVPASFKRAFGATRPRLMPGSSAAAALSRNAAASSSTQSRNAWKPAR